MLYVSTYHNYNIYVSSVIEMNRLLKEYIKSKLFSIEYDIVVDIECIKNM